MKINNEMYYRQALQRLQAIPQNIASLINEQQQLKKDVIDYQITDLWLDNRGLELSDTKLVIGTAVAEMMTGKSRGSNRKNPKPRPFPKLNLEKGDLELMLQTETIDQVTYETLMGLCGYEHFFTTDSTELERHSFGGYGAGLVTEEGDTNVIPVRTFKQEETDADKA